MKIKFGGSGDISTKNLERAIESIIQARVAHASLTIDSNFIICLIREVLKNREPAHVSEFTLESKSELREDQGSESETVALRKAAPKKRKRRVKTSSKTYWLDSKGARAAAAVLLLIFITIPILMLL